MDLLYALDDRFQEGTIEAAAIAPVARLLGADTIMVANDTAFERFRTVRPEQAWGVYTAGVPGLGHDHRLRRSGPQRPGGARSSTRPRSSCPASASRCRRCALVARRVRTRTCPGRQWPAAARRRQRRRCGRCRRGGLIDGVEVVAYTAALDDDLLGEQLGAGAGLIVTDSNRDRAHHWRNAQDVTGFTEAAGTGTADRRSLRPAAAGAAPMPATAIGRSPSSVARSTAQATSYGEPNGYRPEDRPFMAIDGDPTTAWVTADRARAVGEAIEVHADATGRADHPDPTRRRADGPPVDHRGAA